MRRASGSSPSSVWPPRRKVTLSSNQRVGIDGETERARNKRAVHIDLQTVRDLETHALSEAALETASGLAEAAPRAAGAQQRKRRGRSQIRR